MLWRPGVRSEAKVITGAGFGAGLWETQPAPGGHDAVGVFEIPSFQLVQPSGQAWGPGVLGSFTHPSILGVSWAPLSVPKVKAGSRLPDARWGVDGALPQELREEEPRGGDRRDRVPVVAPSSGWARLLQPVLALKQISARAGTSQTSSLLPPALLSAHRR